MILMILSDVYYFAARLLVQRMASAKKLEASTTKDFDDMVKASNGQNLIILSINSKQNF